MTNTEIKNQLINIQKEAEEDSITYDICKDALEEQTDFENPVEYLLERYGDTSLIYDLNEDFFNAYPSDILSALMTHPKRLQSLNKNNIVNEASYLAYQIYLQDILADLGLFVEDNTLFD